jgi:hypothetical protein
LKGELKNWNRNAFGNIQNQVANSVAKLDNIQHKINLDECYDYLFQQEKLAQIELENILNMEEVFIGKKRLES